MNDQITKLKDELREFIELSKTITPGKWEAFQRNEEIGTNYFRITFTDRRSDSLCGYCGEPNAVFIVRSRNISPAMAECLLVAVEGLETIRDSLIVGDSDIRLWDEFNTKLRQILTIWKASK